MQDRGEHNDDRLHKHLVIITAINDKDILLNEERIDLWIRRHRLQFVYEKMEVLILRGYSFPSWKSGENSRES